MRTLDPKDGFDICVYTYDSITNKKNILIEASELDIEDNSFILNCGFTFLESFKFLYPEDESNYKLPIIYIAFPGTEWQVESNNPNIDFKKGGTYELKRCIIDGIMVGKMPGRRKTIMNMKGLFESIHHYDIDIEEFKQT